MFDYGGCGFCLGAGTRIHGGGSSVTRDMSIPASLSSSSNSMYMVVYARQIGPDIHRHLPFHIGVHEIDDVLHHTVAVI